MKRCIFCLITTLCFVGFSVSAAQLTPEQKRAKNEISQALQKIATNVSDYDDETIGFIYQGTKFYVDIVPEDTDPLFISLRLGFNVPEDYDPDLVRIAATDAANGMPVFVFSEKGLLIFDCEMYVKDASPFIAVLPDMITALLKSFYNFPDAYETTLAGHSLKLTGTTLAYSRPNNVFIFPKIYGNDANDSRLLITKVTLDSQYTILDMTSYNGGDYQNCSISKDSYIMANGKLYSLKRADGIAYYPQQTDYPNWESGKDVSLSFKLYFQPLPKGTTTFNFTEGVSGGWQLSNIQLKHGELSEVNGKVIETSTHSWRCISVEIQDGQTIVTKVVTPKKSGSYVYSSQDECVEDANTGKRYYLQESSIGFESSRTISYSTNPIIFYEVYPALPSSVNTINIWSGSSYYVENLKIK